MATHRFVVNVPNPKATQVSVELRLSRAKRPELRWLAERCGDRELKVSNAGIALDSCERSGGRTLKLKIEPFASTDVYVIIRTVSIRQPAGAGFHLIDRRGGKDVGGVLLACVEPLVTEGPGQVVTTPNPCPAVLATACYPVPTASDPSKVPASRTISPGASFELVAAITNPTAARLTDTQVYLEHLGASNAEFTAGSWNIGTLAPKDTFFATWPVRTTVWQSGSFNVSVVVMSNGAEPVRLNSTMSVRRG